MWFSSRQSPEIPSKEEALKGRNQTMPVSGVHFVNRNITVPPFAPGMLLAQFGLGCFWGAEKVFWQADGVYATAVGYGAGHTPNPTYDEVCTGFTGHNEVVLVAYDPNKTDFQALLSLFWQSHNPTQGMRQGNDVGTQYRSGIYVYNDEQRLLAKDSKETYQKALQDADFGRITTEIVDAGPFYYAEDYHQQYLAKNPNGYCGLGGTGVRY